MSIRSQEQILDLPSLTKIHSEIQELLMLDDGTMTILSFLHSETILQVQDKSSTHSMEMAQAIPIVPHIANSGQE